MKWLPTRIGVVGTVLVQERHDACHTVWTENGHERNTNSTGNQWQHNHASSNTRESQARQNNGEDNDGSSQVLSQQHHKECGINRNKCTENAIARGTNAVDNQGQVHTQPDRDGELDHLGWLELNTNVEPVSVTTRFNSERCEDQELQADGGKKCNSCPLSIEHQW